MLTTFLLASALPLVQVDATDTRFDEKRTFVSGKAETALAGESDAEVLCLDMLPGTRHKSICLVRSEWKKAVTMAEAAPKLRNSSQIYNHSHSSFGSAKKYGIGSNASRY
ncbi:hypothetical protein [Parerythrobacter jejuensis]|uniref:Uncharacterized protein n=1 Tax=Parerythrobacter jejuensis TaxID=795812 RepID=A0A845ATX2_9SPHN|nr:hypothetical protein [Parerythrobacter jejuensis]MXP32271.1 hypothetical protein [Parerythrobacter jejuensis]